MKQPIIIAVDFDGTLFTETAYGEIGAPIWKVIEFCKREQAKGNIIILWTCRNGDDLTEAITACANVGLYFDYINENCAANLAEYSGVDNRKIYADLYIDDKSINVGDI